MGRTMKRISLTAWIFIGMAAGVGPRDSGPRIFAKNLGPVSNVLFTSDPLDYRAAVIRHAGGGNRGRRANEREMKARWAASV